MDWSYVPSSAELENHLSLYLSHGRESESLLSALGRRRARLPPYARPSVGISYFKLVTGYRLTRSSYITHNTSDVTEIRELYSESGFDTKVILQDPFGHRGPTVACPIGFPSTLRKRYKELRRFNRWICRVHVDIGDLPKTQRLISIPHIEPDPAFHTLDHIWDTFIFKHVVRGKPAVEILRSLLVR